MPHRWKRAATEPGRGFFAFFFLLQHSLTILLFPKAIETAG
ncbi:hypothetical protein USDA257_c03170 [Sinorhizobium fredii USDA 257]|uniref:Uncharacterized protein n=1 Tax=Sinorhizobium fredii (strain USDA 257) TaxID=1185652 RepID=I3WZ59_SINF2|nr:hypothetical protein USDA257_c03170 [Sinorhizobium fredii USDA 257]